MSREEAGSGLFFWLTFAFATLAVAVLTVLAFGRLLRTTNRILRIMADHATLP